MMTNSEAVEILKISLEADKNGIKYCHDKIGIEALDMAIKALEDKGYEQGYADGWAECLDYAGGQADE